MSIINCSSNCIYEDDGKCTLDHVEVISCSSNQDCGFFQEKNKKRTSQSSQDTLKEL